MAMIECPNCRMQISDKARQCVHCGTIFVPKEKMVCVECEAELEEGVSICPMCGCPIGTRADAKDLRTFQQMKEIGTSMGGKSRKAVVIVAVIVLLIVAAVAAIGIAQYQKKKAAEETAQQLQEYSENLELVTSTMLSGAADSENCCNLIVQVWNNAIWEREDSATDQYTRPDGHFVTDFNEALNNLFADSDFYMQINNIVENQDAVNSLIGQLKNPPEEYKEAYKALSECYDAYRTFTNMAINPTGSLKSFSADFDAADTEFMHCYHVMEFYLQE